MRIEGLRTENELFDSALLFSDVVVFAVVGVVSSANNGFVVVVDNFVVVVVDDVGDNVLDDVVLAAVDSVASVVVFRGVIFNVSIEVVCVFGPGFPAKLRHLARPGKTLQSITRQYPTKNPSLGPGILTDRSFKN